MKKIVLFTLSCFLFGNLLSQDEYNPPKKVEEETQIRTTKDSITIVNKEEVKKTDKSFEGISEFRRNLRIGGGIALSSYTYGSSAQNWQMLYAGLSPQITYKLSDAFEGGLSTSYTYNGTFGDINQHTFYAGPIIRAYPFEGFFLQVEGLGFYTDFKALGNTIYKKFDFNAYVGGGYMSRLSETSYVLTGIKVNLMKNALTNNLIIPVPFTSIHFGLWQ